MKTALIAVDMQADFMPGGALAVTDGNLIVDPMVKLAKEMDLVIASRDWHPANHKSFTHHGGEFPAHCIQETPGAKIVPKVRRLAQFIISKGTEPNSESYSAFAGSTLRPKYTLNELLKKNQIERVIVGGLALDLCVRYTALDAAASGYLTIVGLDITRPLTVKGEQQTLAEFVRAGIQVQPVAC